MNGIPLSSHATVPTQTSARCAVEPLDAPCSASSSSAVGLAVIREPLPFQQPRVREDESFLGVDVGHGYRMRLLASTFGAQPIAAVVRASGAAV